MKHVALLRGINVGKAKRVPMAELRELLEALGFTGVKTLLNSGNAIFSGKGADAALGKKIEQAIAKRFEFDVDVVVRSEAEIKKVIALDPLGQADDDSKYLVAFLSSKPAPKTIKPILDADYGKETCAAKGTEFYAFSPGGVLECKSLQALTKSKAVDHMTVRNWRTVKKIAEAMVA